MRLGLWWRYLLLGVLAIAVYPLISRGPARDLLYVVIGVSSVAAIFVGVRLHRPDRCTPWYLMAAGQLLWVVGDAIDSWRQDIDHVNVFPGAADVFYPAAYPVLGAGLLLLIRRRRPGRDIAGLLDSVTVTAGLGLLSWVLVARPTIVAAEHSYVTATVGLAYPVCDILLAGLLIRLITGAGGRTPAFRFLMAAVALLIAGDTTSAAMGLLASADSRFYDAIWLSSYVFWGVSGLHPSMKSLSAPSPSAERPFTRARLMALILATLVAPMTLAGQQVAGVRLDVWAVVIGSVVLFGLVVGRMVVAIEQIVATNRIRDKLQDSLRHQAAHDSLTELPNRAQALLLIEGALNRARRNSAIIGLLFVDLDNFKAVNDRFGHRAGDEVLRAVAQRMKAEVRGGDIVARLGGDEFVVLLEPLDTQSSALDIAHRVIQAASAPILISAGQEVRVGASIGVAISQDGAINPGRLLHEADTAAYRAKSAGRGRAEVFDSALRAELAERSALEAAIINAIDADEFVVYYQPVIDLRTGGIQGYEALVRWLRPGVGLVMPAEFIPTAEASMLICKLDVWVLRAALAQLAAWIETDPAYRDISVAVNISGRHVSDPRILFDVQDALAQSGVAASQLILEITETVLVEDLLAIRHLEELRAVGVAISIDDFGTGYNSFSRLQNLPVDIIKIDRSFVDGSQPTAGRLLALMVQAAHAFGLPVIAEGVEHNTELQALRLLDCEAAQGYYFAAAMTAKDAEQFFVRHRAALSAGGATVVSGR